MTDATDPTAAATTTFVERFLADAASGGVRPLDDYLADSAEPADAIRAEYDVLTDEWLRFTARFLEDENDGNVAPVDDYVARFPARPALIRVGYAQLVGERADRAEVPLQRIGHYRVLERIGRGGQGIVYLAEDERLKRKVALKVLGPAYAGLDSMRRRLEREAEATSRLDHPGICAIYEMGEADGLPYIAMRYVPGETLEKKIRASRDAAAQSTFVALASRDDSQPGDSSGARRHDRLVDAVAFIEHAARALHVAHEAGLVHRDIKPGNIMVTPSGEPVLLDFGLARDLASDQPTLTQSGQQLGTPAYMSPEQLSSNRGSVDRRTDVYSLAVTLYECLTLARPFEASSREALYRRILTEDAPDPRRANRKLSPELAVILATALEKRPERRYPTAEAFAEDLRRWRMHEPIHARPISPLGRALRWVRRNPAVAGSSAIALVSLVAGLAIALWQWREARQRADDLSHSLTAEKAARREAEGRRLLAQAVIEIESDPARALQLALAGAERVPEREAYDSLYRVLAAHHERRILRGHESYVERVRVSQDGKRVLSVDLNGVVILWDFASGRLIRRFPSAGQWVAVAFSSDSRTAISASRSGTIRIVRAADGVNVRDPVDVGTRIRCLLPSRDGDHAYVGGDDGTVRRIALTATEKPTVVTKHGKAVVALASSRDGRRIASLGDEQVVHVVEHDGIVSSLRLVTGRRVHGGAFETQLREPQRVNFLHDDRRVIVFAKDASVAVWDTAARVLERTIDRPGWEAMRVSVDPTGRRAFIQWKDTAADAWHQEIRDLDTDRSVYLAPLYAEDAHFDWAGRVLAVESFEKAVLVNAADGRFIHELRGHRYRIRDATFTADGKHVITAAADQTVRIWARAPIPVHAGLIGSQRPINFRSDVSPDGRFAIAPDRQADGSTCLALVDVANGQRLRPIAPMSTGNWERGARFDASARQAWVADPDRLELWDLDPPEVRWRVDRKVKNVGFSPDGSRVVWCIPGAPSRVEVVESTSGRVLLSGECDDDGTALLSPDNRLLVLVYPSQQRIRVADAESLETVTELRYDHWPISAAFTPDGKRLIVFAMDTQAHIYDVDTWECRGRIGGLPKTDCWLRVAPDGRHAAVWCQWSVVLFDPSNGQRIREWKGKQYDQFFCVQFPPDGQSLLIGTIDGTIRFFPLDPVAYARRVASRELTAEERERFGLSVTDRSK